MVLDVGLADIARRHNRAVGLSLLVAAGVAYLSYCLKPNQVSIQGHYQWSVVGPR